MYHLESAFVSFFLWKRYISSVKSSMSWFSLLQRGHSAMHACTCTRKHNDVCTPPLPRYIIISTPGRLSGVLDVWRVEKREKRKEGADGKMRTATGLQREKHCHRHTAQCSCFYTTTSPQTSLRHEHNMNRSIFYKDPFSEIIVKIIMHQCAQLHHVKISAKKKA